MVLALVVPTIQVVLVDSTKRRTDFLDRGRGRARTGRPGTGASGAGPRSCRRCTPTSWWPGPSRRSASWPAWSLPHLIGGGSLLAMKGESAAQELNRDAAGLRRLGVISHELLTCPRWVPSVPSHVIRLVKGSRTGPAKRPKSARPDRPSHRPRPLDGRRLGESAGTSYAASVRWFQLGREGVTVMTPPPPPSEPPVSRETDPGLPTSMFHVKPSTRRSPPRQPRPYGCSTPGRRTTTRVRGPAGSSPSPTRRAASARPPARSTSPSRSRCTASGCW